MKTLVIFATVLPEPNSTAAGTRMLQLIELFQAQNFKITFLHTATKGAHSTNLEALRVEVIPIQLNDSSLDALLTKLQPDIVVFDRFTLEEQFGWRVSEVCPRAIKVLDTEDLHFLRRARQSAYAQQRAVKNSDLQNEIFHREMASILRCDLSLIISEFEQKLLSQTFRVNPNLLHYLPLFSEPLLNTPTFEQRANFLSIGNFLHAPNFHTVLELKKLWPKLKQNLPKAKLLIYGAYASDKVYALHNENEGFLVKGRAELLKEVLFSARVILAPIPFGAGLKGKLIDAMSHGLPSISSSVGAEGIEGNEAWNGFICDSREEFIDKATLLYGDEGIWNQSQKAGYRLLENRFNRENFCTAFSEKISVLLVNREAHRLENYLGALLQHHSMQSTKYLSRWIEEKSKTL